MIYPFLHKDKNGIKKSYLLSIKMEIKLNVYFQYGDERIKLVSGCHPY